MDTSTWWGGLALVESVPGEEGSVRVVAESGARVERSHAGHLLDWADWLLERAGWSRNELDGFVATRGPGSFTGVRVGLGTVRGLALAADRPCVGVGTLDALAEAHGPAERDRIALLAAGRGEVYGARYAPASSPATPTSGPWLCGLDSLRERCTGEAVLVPGPDRAPGWPGSADLPRRLRIALPARGIAAAAGRLVLLEGLPAAGAISDLSPLYVRPPDAEVNPRPTRPRR